MTNNLMVSVVCEVTEEPLQRKMEVFIISPCTAVPPYLSLNIKYRILARASAESLAAAILSYMGLLANLQELNEEV